MRLRTIRIVALLLVLMLSALSALGWDLHSEQNVTDSFIEHIPLDNL